MAMNLMHATMGKPEWFTPEEGTAFNAADNHLQGCIISVLAENLVETYLAHDWQEYVGYY